MNNKFERYAVEPSERMMMQVGNNVGPGVVLDRPDGRWITVAASGDYVRKVDVGGFVMEFPAGGHYSDDPGERERYADWALVEPYRPTNENS